MVYFGLVQLGLVLTRNNRPNSRKGFVELEKIMKKLMIATLAMVAAASIVSADPVTSANVVGYSTVTIHPGLNMLGTCFQNIGSNTLSIQNLVKIDGLIGYDYDNAIGHDALLIWDPTQQGYPNSYLWAGTVDTTPWLSYDVSGNWIEDVNYTAVNVNLTPGSAVWLNTAITSPTNGLMAGEVHTAGATIPVVNGLTMVANPAPTALSINGGQMTFTGLVGYDYDNAVGHDALLIWDPTQQGYPNTYLWAGTVDTTPWLSYDVSGNWIEDVNYTAVNVTIPVGGACWIQHTGADGSVSFTPISVN